MASRGSCAHPECEGRSYVVYRVPSRVVGPRGRCSNPRLKFPRLLQEPPPTVTTEVAVARPLPRVSFAPGVPRRDPPVRSRARREFAPGDSLGLGRNLLRGRSAVWHPAPRRRFDRSLDAKEDGRPRPLGPARVPAGAAGFYYVPCPVDFTPVRAADELGGGAK